MAYTTIDDPSVYFQTTLYTGNGGTQSITNGGNSDLQPDWVWVKERNGATKHYLFDSVRGVYKSLHSHNADDELDNSNTLTAFNSDGFSIGNLAEMNTSSDTYVSWNWKAGTSFTNDASSTGIGTIDSAGSFNNDSGFSIVSYTGTGSNGTIKHGLNSTPKTIITKKRSASQGWHVQHASLGATKELYLNTGDAAATGSTPWNNTTPTASVFSVGTSGGTNGSSATYIAYCFAEKQGYSKFSSYVANGSADGGFVYTGFKIGWLMIKRTDSAAGWIIYDSKREGRNTENDYLLASSSSGEGGNNEIDLYSNGFKPREANRNELNVSGASYVYMAFASEPFVTSTGVPATAR